MLLVGCATTVENEYVAPEGIPHARIRVHHATHAKVYLAPSCDEEPISFDASVGGGLFDSNKKIGMPPTKRSTWPLSSWREYTIPAGYRTRVELDYSASAPLSRGGHIHYKCRPMSFSFIPEAGKDYDTFSYHHTGNRCYIAVRELIKNEGDMATGKLIENDLPPCPKKETQKTAIK